jgi:hypothetical protein
MNINLTLFVQMIAFAVFVAFCMKYVWPPIMKALEERTAKIAEGLAPRSAGSRSRSSASSAPRGHESGQEQAPPRSSRRRRSATTRSGRGEARRPERGRAHQASRPRPRSSRRPIAPARSCASVWPAGDRRGREDSAKGSRRERPQGYRRRLREADLRDAAWPETAQPLRAPTPRRPSRSPRRDGGPGRLGRGPGAARRHGGRDPRVAEQIGSPNSTIGACIDLIFGVAGEGCPSTCRTSCACLPRTSA